jgi:hypothetical protein
MWGALSDERTGLSLTISAGSCQRSHSRVRVPWDSRPYFTVPYFVASYDQQGYGGGVRHGTIVQILVRGLIQVKYL